MPSFQVLCTWLPVRFLSSFPVSLPQPLTRCLPPAFAFGLSPLLPLSFVRFVSGSDYLASVSSFPFSSRLRLTAASSVLRIFFRLCGLPRSLLPGFPCILSRFRYSAFCSFPFALPCFAPTAASQVLTFCSRSGVLPSIDFLSSVFALGSSLLSF